MVATAEVAAVQVAVLVMFVVDPSLYVAVAENCSVAPTAMLGAVGDTEIVVTVGGVTLSMALPLTPLSEAVIAVEPAATAIATPLEFTVATVGVAAVQLALEVTSAVELSLYVAVAVNCCVTLIPMELVEGVTATAVTVFGGVVVPVELDDADWHPVLTITSKKEGSKRERKKIGTEFCNQL